MSPENFKRIREIYSELELDEFLLLLEITKEEFEKAEATGICDEELTRKLKIAEDPVKFFKFILEENSTIDILNKMHQKIIIKVAIEADLKLHLKRSHEESQKDADHKELVKIC